MGIIPSHCFSSLHLDYPYSQYTYKQYTLYKQINTKVRTLGKPQLTEMNKQFESLAFRTICTLTRNVVLLHSYVI